MRDRGSQSYGLASQDMKTQASRDISGIRRTMQRESARENGSLGGQARAERYDEEILSEWASYGGQATLAKYGRMYFVQLRKRRTHYPQRSDGQPLPTIRPAVLSARANGRLGGLARAARYSREHVVEWGRRGGLAVRKLYGHDYFREIRKMRTHYRRGYITQKTKQWVQKECDELAKDGLITSLPLCR